MRHVAFVALLFLAGLAVAGCAVGTATAPRGDDELALAEKAKAAILELARSDPEIFEGLQADRLAHVPLKKGDEPHQYWFGAFTIYVGKRLYAADIGNDWWQHWYNGTFAVDESGRWTANRPHVTYADRFPGFGPQPPKR
jgi:hypothetical protein